MPKPDLRIFAIQDDGRFGSVSSSVGDRPWDEAVTRDGYERSLEREGLGSPLPSRRFRWAFVFLTLLFGGLFARAAQLQVVSGASYRALAERNRVQTRVLPAPRGTIADRFGAPLAVNVPTFALTVRPDELPRARGSQTPEDQAAQQRARDAAVLRASALAGMPPEELSARLDEFSPTTSDEVTLKRGIPYEAAMRIAVALPTLPGFGLQTTSIRSYDTTVRSLSHVLGYAGLVSASELETLRAQGYRPVDAVGKTGLEKSAETLLRGTAGRVMAEVDARGRELRLVDRTDPVPGANLTLSIDLAFQRYAEERLVAMLKRTGVDKASVVALDPRDGAVRALISWPSYDANAFVQGIGAEAYKALAEDPAHPLFPRAVSGEFPAGSTFKPFVSYAALNEGVVNEHTSFLSTGGLSVGPWFFPDWKAGGHGVTDVRKAIAESVNTFFYIVGGGYDATTGLGVERITDYARRFGFGQKTGIDLPGEADGFLPSKEWKEKAKGERWFVGDTYHLAIGQGDLLATPLQLAAAGAVIANGGHRVTPHVVEKVDGTPAQVPMPDGTFETANVTVVRQGMRQAVTSGSARFLNDLKFPVAGKTGTAQPGGDVKTHAWFLGFGPYQDPTLTIVVLLENGGEGSSFAVPIAKDLFAWWFAHRGPADTLVQ